MAPPVKGFAGLPQLLEEDRKEAEGDNPRCVR